MPMVAQQMPYTLFIIEDHDAGSPREDRDNFGRMLCWHNRYNLGDEHAYREPEDFMREKLFDFYGAGTGSDTINPVCEFIKLGQAKGIRLEYNQSSKEWELFENQYWSSNSDWYVSSACGASLDGADIPDWFLDDCLSAVCVDELTTLVKQMEGMVILPLYLYDHSGITMSTSSFSCPWDSGQVGWIYADAEMVRAEYGEVTPETLEKARALLESEVEEYDLYLTGQSYGFRLFKGDAEIESCWGFLGRMEDIPGFVREFLPSECDRIVDFLEYRYVIDEDEYLELALEADNEEGLEM